MLDRIAPANGGILILQDGPDVLNDGPHLRGVIVAAGNGVPWLNIGDTIIVDNREATRVIIDPEQYSWPFIRGPHAQSIMNEVGLPLYLCGQRSVLAKVGESRLAGNSAP